MSLMQLILVVMLADGTTLRAPATPELCARIERRMSETPRLMIAPSAGKASIMVVFAVCLPEDKGRARS